MMISSIEVGVKCQLYKLVFATCKSCVCKIENMGKKYLIGCKNINNNIYIYIYNMML